MARTKIAQSDKAHAEPDNVPVSNQPADGQAAAAMTGRGMRRAKTDALNNAVWKQTQNGASRKRVASESTPQNAVRKNKKINKAKANDEHVTPEAVVGHVSIPLPGAPKKVRAATKPRNKPQLNSSAPKAKPSTADTAVDANDDFDDDIEAEGSSSETDASNGTSEEDDDQDDEENLSINPKVGSAGNLQTAAAKRFATEKKPDVSQLNAPKSLIIRGQVIEISDDEDEDHHNNSPTSHLAAASSQAPKRALTERQATIAADPTSNNSTSVNANVNNTNGTNNENISNVVPVAVMDNAGSIWPLYTKLIRGPRDITLNVQTLELKLILRKAMDLAEERVRFQNAFPSFVQRTSWNRTVLVEACAYMMAMTHVAQVREKYEMFQERMRVDTEYVGEISRTLLDPCISILRGDTKTAAINNARLGYKLINGCAIQVQSLLASSRYIYPKALNNMSFQYNRPFENKAIIGTLRDDLFTGNAITLRYPHRFQTTEEETEPNKVSPAMIALAATAVYASLKEWETGIRIPASFSATLFESIYSSHIKHLSDIQSGNPNAYLAMLRRLFHLAANVENAPADNFTLTDVQNMDLGV